MEGRKEILGLWINENESASFWTTVCNELKNRGVQDILIACHDNLKEFSTAINTVFPKTENQLCIIHQIRNSTKFVSYKDLKPLMSDLKKVYQAVRDFIVCCGNTPKTKPFILPMIPSENPSICRLSKSPKSGVCPFVTGE